MQHHTTNWNSCPPSIVKRIQSLIQTVSLPSPNQVLNKELADISDFVSERLQDVSQEHFEKEYSDAISGLSSREFHDISPRRFLEALSVIKRWALESYKKVNTDFLNVICHELNRKFRHLKVEYQHGKFKLIEDNYKHKLSCDQSKINPKVSSFCDANTQTQDSGYQSHSEPNPGLIVDHPPATDFTEDNINDYGIKLDHRVEVLVVATDEYLTASPEIVPKNWEVHCFEYNPGPDDVSAIVSTIDGVYPDKIIIDLEPNNLQPDSFSEGLEDLVSYCQNKFVDECYFTYYDVTDKMPHNKRVNTSFHYDYVWDHHGQVIGPMNNHDWYDGSIPNYKLKFLAEHMEKVQ